MDPVLAVIDEALLRAGLSDSAASKLAVGNYALIKNMRSARSDDKRYSYQALEQLARVLDLECYFGPKRRSLGFSESENATDLGQRNAARAGYLTIPWHMLANRRGSSPFSISQLWLEAEGLIPDHLQAIVPNQVSFSLTDAKNTVAVMSVNAPRKGSDGYWCYKDGPTLGIARVAFSTGFFVMLPHDDGGEIRIVHAQGTPSQVMLLGRVVWLGVAPKP